MDLSQSDQQALKEKLLIRNKIQFNFLIKTEKITPVGNPEKMQHEI